MEADQASVVPVPDIEFPLFKFAMKDLGSEPELEGCHPSGRIRQAAETFDERSTQTHD